MPARLLLVFVCALLASQTHAQQSCPPIPVTPPDCSALLFSPQQENDLGEIISEHMQSSFLVIDEDDINDYLRKVSDRDIPKGTCRESLVAFMLCLFFAGVSFS